jgi:hypothetical protein
LFGEAFQGHFRGQGRYIVLPSRRLIASGERDEEQAAGNEDRRAEREARKTGQTPRDRRSGFVNQGEAEGARARHGICPGTTDDDAAANICYGFFKKSRRFFSFRHCSGSAAPVLSARGPVEGPIQTE